MKWLWVVMAATLALLPPIYGLNFSAKISTGTSKFLTYNSENNSINDAFNLSQVFSLALGCKGLVPSLSNRFELGILSYYVSLYSKYSGAYTTQIVALPIFIEYTFLKRSHFSFSLRSQFGGGLGFFANSLTGEKITNALLTFGLAERISYRKYFPNILWLAFEQDAIAESSKEGISSTYLLGLRASIGFSFIWQSKTT